MFQNIGRKLFKDFYFSIGGIGDFILAVSSFIDSIPDGEKVSMIFWATNMNVINAITDDDSIYGDKIQKVLTTPNFMFRGAVGRQYFDQIVNDPRFKGKAHIPDNLNYVQEWWSVKDVFDHYNIPRHVKFWKEKYYNEKYKDMVLVHPYSAEGDRHKDKHITPGFMDIIIEKYGIDNIVFSGSVEDIQKVKKRFGENVNCTRLITEAMSAAVSVKEVHATDTWVKTLSAISGVPTTLYYYHRAVDPEQIFGKGITYDPGDNIFIKGWDMTVVDQFGDLNF